MVRMIEDDKQQLLGGHAVERLRLRIIATKPAKFRNSNLPTQLCDIIICNFFLKKLRFYSVVSRMYAVLQPGYAAKYAAGSSRHPVESNLERSISRGGMYL
jgi:hypothetical protein